MRKLPGLLRLLPETLPFYPYSDDDNKRPQCKPRKRKDNFDAECLHEETNEEYVIPDTPLHVTCNEGSTPEAGFTLFFFVDSTNRHSLLAIPKVSLWFHHALSNGNSDVVCIPNHPSPHEINVRDSTADPIIQASINSSVASSGAKGQHVVSMLLNTGLFHLPFLHPKRLSLLHLLGATRDHLSLW